MKVVVRIKQDGRGRHQASCPELPGCRASGRSRVEAVANIELAIRGCLASLNRPVSRRLRKVVVPA